MLNALYYTTNFQFMASQYIKKCCLLLAREMSFILLFILLGKNKCRAHACLHPHSSLGKADFPPFPHSLLENPCSVQSSGAVPGGLSPKGARPELLVSPSQQVQQARGLMREMC